MSAVSISLKKLQKYLPAIDRLQEKIETRLDNMTDLVLSQLEDKIAYLVLNPDLLPVGIDLNLLEQGQYPLVARPEHYYAAVLLQREMLEVELLGTPVQAQQYFQVQTVSEIIRKNEYNFSWQVDLNSTWLNETYVTEKLANLNLKNQGKISANHMKALEEKLQYIVPDILDSHSFIESAQSATENLFTQALPVSALERPAVWNYLKQNPAYFPQHVFNVFKEVDRYNGQMTQAEALINKESIFSRFVHEFLSDEKFAREYVKHDSRALWFAHLPENLRGDESVLDSIYLAIHAEKGNNHEISLYEHIPPAYFSSTENVIKYMNNAYHYDTAFKYNYGSNQKQTNLENLCKGCFQTKEDILNFFDKVSSDTFSDLDVFLPENLKMDLDILAMRISKNHYIYPSLDTALRKNEKLAIAYIEQEYMQISQIPKGTLDKFKDIEKIASWVQGNKNILKSKRIPSFWLETPEIIIEAIDLFCELPISDETWSKIYQNKGYVEKIMQVNQSYNSEVEAFYENFYQNMPPRLKSDPEIAFQYIKRNYYDSKKVKATLPSAMWFNHDFCLKLVLSSRPDSIAKDIVEMIPEVLWQDPVFIRKMFKRADESHDTLSASIPTEVRQFITNFELQKGNYLKFFNTYTLQLELQQELKEKNQFKTKKNKI